MTRFPARRLVVGAVVSALVGLTLGSAQAFNPQPEPPGFGMFGITEIQQAHLHVALPAVQRLRGQHPPDPCRVELSFVNEAGMAVWVEMHTIMPGQTVNMTFTPTRTIPTDTLAADVAPIRHQLRAVVMPLDRAFPPGPCRDLVATVQVDNQPVDDQAGGPPTLTLSPRAAGDVNGGRFPTWHLFGPIAIGFGHTARLNAVNVGAGRSMCRIDWAFVDETGARTGGTAMIGAGQAIHADFVHNDTDRGVALIRAEVMASGRMCPSDSTIGTLEGFDSALGHSHTIVPAQLIVPAVQ
jgi:hypothetical protein